MVAHVVTCALHGRPFDSEFELPVTLLACPLELLTKGTAHLWCLFMHMGARLRSDDATPPGNSALGPGPVMAPLWLSSADLAPIRRAKIECVCFLVVQKFDMQRFGV